MWTIYAKWNFGIIVIHCIILVENEIVKQLFIQNRKLKRYS